MRNYKYKFKALVTVEREYEVEVPGSVTIGQLEMIENRTVMKDFGSETEFQINVIDHKFEPIIETEGE